MTERNEALTTSNNALDICIHRGSQQIGGSCVEISYQGQRLIVDLGLPLDAPENTVDQLPAVKGLVEGDPSIVAVLISHPHQDHFGLLRHIHPSIPVAIGAAARRIVDTASQYVPDALPLPAGPSYTAWQPFVLGPFTITPYLMDHSAYDAYAFVIEANDNKDKRVFYSGDFRGHGRKSKLFDQFLARPPQHIEVALVEGSSLNRAGMDELYATETELEAQFTDAMKATAGMSLVYCSAQNIDRIVTVYRACLKAKRTLVMDLYAAQMLAATGNEAIPQSDWGNIAVYIPRAQQRFIKDRQLFNELKSHSARRIFGEALAANPEQYTLLFRPMHMADLERHDALQGASFLYSQWEGYWSHESTSRLRALIEKNGIVKQSIHTSGHASPPHLKQFINALNPRRLVPIHSFAPQRYTEIFPATEPHLDGEFWSV
jgi:ribonuclease J